MELTIHEVTWLCQIIEVKRLMGFAPFLILQKEEVDTVQQGLLDKKIISEGKLSAMGLSIVEALRLYANAKRYIKLGENSVFANYQDKEYILITKGNPCFSIDMVTQDIIVSTILAKFTTLPTIQDGDYKRCHVGKQEFAAFMEEHEDAQAIFYSIVDTKTNLEKEAVMFIADGYFQRYDADLEQLEKCPRNQVQQGIERIFIRETVQ